MINSNQIKRISAPLFFCLFELFISFVHPVHSQNTDTSKITSKIEENMGYFVGTWEGELDRLDGRHMEIKVIFEWGLDRMAITSKTWEAFDGGPMEIYFLGLQSWNFYSRAVEFRAVNKFGLIVTGEYIRAKKDLYHMNYTAWGPSGNEFNGRDVYKILDKDTYEWSFWDLIDGEYKRQKGNPIIMHRVK